MLLFHYDYSASVGFERNWSLFSEYSNLETWISLSSSSSHLVPFTFPLRSSLLAFEYFSALLWTPLQVLHTIPSSFPPSSDQDFIRLTSHPMVFADLITAMVCSSLLGCNLVRGLPSLEAMPLSLSVFLWTSYPFSLSVTLSLRTKLEKSGF